MLVINEKVKIVVNGGMQPLNFETDSLKINSDSSSSDALTPLSITLITTASTVAIESDANYLPVSLTAENKEIAFSSNIEVNAIKCGSISLSNSAVFTAKTIEISNPATSVSMSSTNFEISDGEKQLTLYATSKLNLAFDASKSFTLTKFDDAQTSKLVLTPTSAKATEVTIVLPEDSGVKSTHTITFSKSLSKVYFRTKSSTVIPKVSPTPGATRIIIDNQDSSGIDLGSGTYSTSSKFNMKFSESSKTITYSNSLSLIGSPFDKSFTTETIYLKAPVIEVTELTQDITQAVLMPTKSLSISGEASKVYTKLQDNNAAITVSFSDEDNFPLIESQSVAGSTTHPQSFTLKTKMSQDSLLELFEGGKIVASGLYDDCEYWRDALRFDSSVEGFNSGTLYRTSCNSTGSSSALYVTSDDSSLEEEGLDTTTIVIIIVSVIVGVCIILLIIFLIFRKKIISACKKSGTGDSKKKRRKHRKNRDKEESVLDDIGDVRPEKMPGQAAEIEIADDKQAPENKEATFQVGMPLKLPSVPSRVKASDLDSLPTNNGNNIPSQFQRTRSPDMKQTLTMAGTMGPVSGQKKKGREFNTAPSALNEV